MQILVYIADGRTVYLLENRHRLALLVGAEVWHESRSTRVARGTWNPITGEYGWLPVGLRYLRKASIAAVEEAPRGLADAVLPAEREPEEALAG